MRINLFISILLLCSANAMAKGYAVAGKEKSLVCQSCHGETGNQAITPDIPNLAGQHQDYLEHALRAYRSGDREQAVMSTFAQQLSDQDIQDLAAYFASQSGVLQDLSIK